MTCALDSCPSYDFRLLAAGTVCLLLMLFYSKYLYILPMVILKQTDPWEHVSVRLHQVFVVLCLGNIVMEVC